VRRWRGYDYGDLQELARSTSEAYRSERLCPACGQVSVRSYRYPSERSTGTTQVSYVWCVQCHRYHGATSPRVVEGLSDPLTPHEHAQLDDDLPRLFDRLDQLWDEGALPR
jgi:hypothetical protein